MYSFSLTPEQVEKYLAWNEAHKTECKYFNKAEGRYTTGSIGGRVSFEFSSTGLGTVTRAKCACGKEIDLTDYENW